METEVKNSTMYNHSKENETRRYILKTNTKYVYWKFQNADEVFKEDPKRCLCIRRFNIIEMSVLFA